MTFEPIWNSIIAWYLFLAGLGGGAYVSAAFLRWRHPEAVNMIRIGRVIAPVVVIVGLCLLMFDATAGLHNPLRFALLLTNFGSVMTWGVVFLGGFTILALIGAGLDLAKRRVPLWLDIAAAVFGVCVAVYTGCLLGVCKTFPLWNNALLPILFLVSAMSTGMAAVLCVAIFRHPEEFNRVGVFKKFHFCLPIIELVLVASLLFVTASNASPAGWESVMNLVGGDCALAFWFLFVLVGLVLPTALETWLLFFSPKEFEESRKAHWISFASDAGVLVGGFVLRLLVLVAAMPLTLVVPWY
ncbi:NrfD/PsrC family molybdoenzyme membrane anchor subunit [Enterorhabdus sp. P55]|jgi:polysulfide reductase chain C|uniref:NrfD/PsrC family molybdoenzyme membrane anchor subunit n=1 Tax=Enterorhabdus sp. P55 TaxID=2304571 RepID=UPI00136858C1|nr:NrfD/PsrC family molybdoenzyme membrane anchor subunit [Enterorhabdus sp. P55]MCI8451496.1 polysulfide reductase NrfD [Eggerthellaceae bacterium]NBI32906.1 polysulfide reductase [Enterorhabdus sp. P55]